ncbi:MAG: hypothetical protein BZY87_04910 [SAR202 cluster bacterium Io17-Chloro-G6]|nr:MAG: hypothetical protein BZY87_04910 [SAR202 cluster bacterium Io17-Chloro-G6]
MLFLTAFVLAGLGAGLMLLAPRPTGVAAQELDFGQNGGSKSGSGEFLKFVPQGGRTVIGKIPVGITDLTIELSADADLDIELWDGDVFVAGWEADGAKARVYSETEVTAAYNGVEITWSGWNGVGGNPGNESIKLSGATKNTFVIKVFGYQDGNAEVVYSWAGGGVDGPDTSGSATFSKLVPQHDRSVIGTIPAGVDSLRIDLTSANDLDIELWDEKALVVGWQVDGRKSLIYSNTPVSGLYNGVRIAWSGWDGVNGQKGDEYIRISGTTQNSFVMKVFGYQGGRVDVVYSWGSDTYAATAKSTPAPSPTPVPTPGSTKAPAPAPTSTSTPQPAALTVKTWAAGFDALWSYGPNWSPPGVPKGDELVVIEGNSSDVKRPIMDVDFTLTTGTISIGAVNSILRVAKGVTFKIDGTVNAQGDLLNEGTVVNNGVYNNEAKIVVSGASASFTIKSGGVLNNLAGGSSTGVIIKACGGTVNDLGELGVVTPAACIWSGAGVDDKWSNAANWANDLVPPEDHPVLINGEGGGNAKVQLDINLSLQSRSLTLGPGDALTIGSGDNLGSVTLSVEQPGGHLINHGTVLVSNYSTLQSDPLATIENITGAIRNACRGSASVGGIAGANVVQAACFWDGGGKTGNWSEAANWDSDTVPTSKDRVLIGALTTGVSGATVNTSFDPTAGVTGVTLDRSFDLSSLGTLTVGAGQTLNVGEGITLRIADDSPGGSIWINGTLNLNGGTLHNDKTGLITNHGTINVIGGTLNNQGNFLVNESDGSINNVGGLISNVSTFTNSGTLLNDAGSTVLHGNGATMTNRGTFTNAGSFYTSSGAGDFVNRLGGTLVNSGTLNQGGLGTFSNLADSRITNSGRINMLASLFDNRGAIENTGTLEVFHFASYQNLKGQLENQAGGIFSNSGLVSNLGGSTINNSGSIINERTLLNVGAINNACGGTVAGPVSGDQPVSTCTES